MNGKRAPGAKPIVCIVEPNTEVARALIALLRPLQAELSIYTDGESVLLAVSDGGLVPSCLIAATALPDGSGLELYQELGRRGFVIPTILLASDEDIASAVRAMKAGVLDYFEKPFIDDRLLYQVEFAVSGAAAGAGGPPE